MSAAESMKLPIVKIAAGAVIVLCGVGVAAMTGLIPGVSSQDKTAQPTEPPAVQAPATEPAPVQKHVSARPAVKEHVRVAAAKPVQEERPAPPCTDCGVIESINTVEVAGEASGAGAVAGGLAGLIVGNQIGKGKGRTLAKIAGAAGGAYAGHQIEKNMKKTAQYQIGVRMNDGTLRTITQASADGLSNGSRVKIKDGTVVLN